jgi:hypothetical protein
MSTITSNQVDQMVLAYHRGVERMGLGRDEAMREACGEAGLADLADENERLRGEVAELKLRHERVVEAATVPLAAAA